jgi:L-alanine-DL-glutamate epimerase-like enolase superfamily enzyme
MRAAITNVTAGAYTIPTDRPEGDGTLAWDSTTIVIARVAAAGVTGLGYTYASRAAAALIGDLLAGVIHGLDAFDIPARWNAMRAAARNLGVTGQVSAAIAAVDTALWDLKARLLGVPLAALMGAAAASVKVYGSGGFTTYDAGEIEAQIGGWREAGITMAKIKIGAHPDDDPRRVAAARNAVGGSGHLFVDVNGAYGVKQALEFAACFREYGVEWFEEPVTSDNLAGLRQIRDSAPAGMEIAAGEYAWNLFDIHRMLDAKAVDVLQIDATRCLGYSGFIRAAAVAGAHNIPVSSHCAPALHLPVCCHAPHLRHMEYFHDHVRIENMLFDGTPAVRDGRLTPDHSRAGHGLILKERDAERYAA